VKKAKEILEDAMKEAKFKHIFNLFNSKHNLDELIKQLGSEETFTKGS
jgi:hypothetical protein